MDPNDGQSTPASTPTEGTPPAAPEGAAPAAAPEGAAPAATAAPQNNIMGDPAPKPEVNWRDGIPEELRPTVDKFNTPSDMAQSYLSLQQKLTKGIEPPGADATEQDIALYNKRIGKPESVDGYDIRISDTLRELSTENLDDEVKGFIETIHGANTHQEMAQKGLDYFTELQQKNREQLHAALDRAHTQNIEALKEAWGPDYDRNTALANRAFKSFESSEALKDKVIGTTKFTDDADVVKLMAEVGRRMGESSPMTLMDTQEVNSKQERFNELNLLMVTEPDRNKREAYQKELTNLGDQLYPTPRT